VALLQQTLERVRSGQMDIKLANTVAYLSNSAPAALAQSGNGTVPTSVEFICHVPASMEIPSDEKQKPDSREPSLSKKLTKPQKNSKSS